MPVPGLAGEGPNSALAEALPNHGPSAITTLVRSRSGRANLGTTSAAAAALVAGVIRRKEALFATFPRVAGKAAASQRRSRRMEIVTQGQERVTHEGPTAYLPRRSLR